MTDTVKSQPKSSSKTRNTKTSMEASSSAATTPTDQQDAVLQAIAALKTEFLSKMEVQSADIKAQVDSIKAELKQDSENTKARLGALESKFTEMETAVTDHSDIIATLQKELAEVQKELAVQKARNEENEYRSRRFNLRVTGIKTAREDGKRPSEYVAQCLKDALNLSELPTLDIAHRTLRQKSSDDEDDDSRPRAFIIRCHYFQEKEEILKLARQKKDMTTADGDNIRIYQDFTQAVAKLRSKFNYARSLLRSCDGVRFGLWYPAELKITTTKDGVCTNFKDHVKAEEFIKKNLNPKK